MTRPSSPLERRQPPDPECPVMLSSLGPAALDELAAALEGGRMRLPCTRTAVRRLVGESIADETLRELTALHAQGFTVTHAAVLLRTLARERRHQQQSVDQLELVWSGPDAPGTSPRDTAVVIRSLCSVARRSILIANYAFDRAHDGEALTLARALWQPVADAMDHNPELVVRLFVHIDRDDRSIPDKPASFWVNRFRKHFCTRLWPGKRLPELFYDPRGVHDDPTERANLHAKCVLIDNTHVFLTSANLTQAGQQRNIEAGLLLTSPSLARDLTAQFEALLRAGSLIPIHPGE